MAILVVEHEGTRRAAVLPPRVLIGRKSMNHLVIDHRAVSRLHAWIDGRADGWYIADATSRTGTRVNGEPVIVRRLLNDGDEITIGPARLRFLTDARPPDGAEPFEIPAEPTVSPDDKGVRFDCKCGAPLWAGEGFYGHVGQCTYCGQSLAVPYPSSSRPGGRARKPPVVHAAEAAQRRQDELQITADESAAVAAPADAPAAPAARPWLNARGQEVCGACQSAIGSFEETTVCPACGLTYHADCWSENYGCGAYGCSQVNALKPPDPTPAAGTSPTTPGERGRADEAGAAAQRYAAGGPVAAPPFPWEFLLLAGSVFAALLGAVTFGLPSLAAAGGSVAYLARHRGRQHPAPPRTGVLLASVALALAGVVAGAAVSYVLYFGGRGRT